MGGKKGTLVGRTLLKFIPEASPFHMVAEAVDLGIESLVFDREKPDKLPVKELPEVQDAVHGLKGLLLFAAQKGIVAFNFPVVEGDNEKAAEDGAFKLLKAYVDEATD